MTLNNLTPKIILDILIKHDPIGLHELGAPADEYMVEAEQIYDRVIDPRISNFKCQIKECSFSIEEHLAVLIENIVYSVFVFNFDPIIAGASSPYKSIASDILSKSKECTSKPRLRLIK